LKSSLKPRIFAYPKKRIFDSNCAISFYNEFHNVKKLSFLFFFFLAILLQGQPNIDVSSDYELSTTEARKYQTKLLSFKKEFSGSKKVVKKFDEICDERADYFKEMNDNHQLMAHGQLVDFLQSIVDKIADSNPSIKKGYFKIFVLRSTAVNAHNLGKGIIFFNLGLLARIDHVDELAFIIGHEMAHDQLNHVYKSTADQATFYKTRYKAIKKAARKKYGSATAQEAVITKILASMGLHSRKNETLADELGAKLVIKAGFGRPGVIQALALLRESDEPIWKDTVNIQKMLSTPDYQIKKKHLSQVDAYAPWSQMESLYEIPDSLKTHPHCDDRIDHIKEALADKKGSFADFAQAYQKLQTLILHEYLQCFFEENNVSRALYNAMVVKQLGDDSPFLDGLINWCLYDLYFAIKQQDFSATVDFPDSKFSKGYNKVLEFLQAQNSSRFMKMANGYYHTHLAQADDFELKKIVTLYKTYLETDKLKTTQVKKAQIKNGFYKDFIHQLKQ